MFMKCRLVFTVEEYQTNRSRFGEYISNHLWGLANRLGLEGWEISNVTNRPIHADVTATGQIAAVYVLNCYIPHCLTRAEGLLPDDLRASRLAPVTFEERQRDLLSFDYKPWDAHTLTLRTWATSFHSADHWRDVIDLGGTLAGTLSVNDLSLGERSRLYHELADLGYEAPFPDWLIAHHLEGREREPTLYPSIREPSPRSQTVPQSTQTPDETADRARRAMERREAIQRLYAERAANNQQATIQLRVNAEGLIASLDSIGETMRSALGQITEQYMRELVGTYRRRERR